MIKLHKKGGDRQVSVLVDGEHYEIKTEFYHWLNFGRIIQQRIDGVEITYGEFDKFYSEEPPENREAGFGELCKFYENKKELPRPSKKKTDVITLDWEIDSEFIYAAFLQQYRIDLEKEYPHWHKFLALFYGLVGTKLNDIMSARCSKETKGVMKELREAWRIPNKVKKPSVIPQMEIKNDKETKASTGQD